MSGPADSNGTSDPLDAVVADYLQKAEAGTLPDRDALVAAHPDLADRLRAFFADLDRMGERGGSFRLPDLALPEDFGDYEILGEIGRGGMGVVYRARRKSVGRVVALKMILSGPLADAPALRRFREEAEIVSRLDHPRIVPIYEIGEHRGLPYFTMRLIDGESLTRRLGRYAGAGGDAAVLMFRVCGAVHHAHNRGVLHRDLKPGNILIDAAGEPHVSDFGLARRLEEARTLTTTGAVLGTPGYMAPEQAAGAKDPTVAVDVYGLGAVLYALLTGRPPFQGATVYDTLRRVIEDDPVPPRRLVPDAPAGLEAVCLKCLQKEPARRYRSVAELADDLQRYLAGRPVSARGPGVVERFTRWAGRRPAVAALYLTAAVAAALVGTVAVVASQWQAAEDARDQTASALRDVEVARDAERVARKVAEGQRRQAEAAATELAVEKGKVEHALEALGLAKGKVESAYGSLAEEQKKTEAAREQAVDALAQAKKSRETLEVVEYGRTVQLAHQAWRDGNVRGALGLLEGTRKDLRGWEWKYVQRLCQPQLPAGKLANLDYMAYTPDGRRLVSGGRGGLEIPEVWVWDAWTGAKTILKGRFGSSVGFEYTGVRPWDAECTRIVTVGEHGPVWVWDVRTGELVATLTGHTDRVWDASLSRDGKRVVTAGRDETVRVWDAKTGAEIHRLKGNFPRRASAAFSPDGTRILTEEASELRTWYAATGEPLAALKNGDKPARSHGWAWSPDGKRIVSKETSSDERERMRVGVWDADTGAKLVTLEAMPNQGLPRFSPDGTRIILPTGIWDSRTGARLAKLQADEGSSVADCSADGTRVVTCDSLVARVWNAWTVDEVAVLKGHSVEVWSASFSPDGKRVLTTGHDGTVRVWDARTGSPVTILLVASPGDQTPTAAWSPDGTRVFTSVRGEVRQWDVRPEVEIPLVLRPHLRSFPSWNRERTRVVLGSPKGAASVWDLASGTEVAAIEGLTATCSWSPDENYLLGPSTGVLARVWGARTGNEVLTLRGHTGPVRSATYSPDGTRIATASDDRSVRVWDARTGAALFVLHGHPRPAGAVLWSPDGTRLVTSDPDGARLWDARTGKELAEFKGDPGAVGAPSFSPDGTRILATTAHDTVRIWSADTGAEVLAIPMETGRVWLPSWSPDGSRVVAATSFETARVWDARTGKELAVLKGHARRLHRAAFSPDGARVLTTAEDQTARIWDAGSGRQLLALKGKAPGTDTLSFTPDGRWIVDLERARAWDATTGDELPVLEADTESVVSSAWGPGGLRVLATFGSRATHAWDDRTRAVVIPLPRHADRVAAAQWLPDGDGLLTVGTGWHVEPTWARTWDLRSGRQVATFQRCGFYRTRLSADGSRVAASPNGGFVDARVWSAATGAGLLTLEGETLRAISPDGSRVLTSNLSRTALWVWDVATGKQVFALEHKDDAVPEHYRDGVGLWGPDGRWLVTQVSSLRRARVWDARTGKHVADCDPIGDHVTWSRDCTRFFAFGFAARHGALIETRTGVATLLKGTDSSRSPSFSPDGSRLVAGDHHHNAHVWDAKTGAELLVLKGHLGVVTGTAYSPDGTRIATAADDGTVRVWDAKTGAELLVLKEPMDPGLPAEPDFPIDWPLAWSPDGGRLMLLSQHAKVCVWDARVLDPARLPPDVAPHPRVKL